MHRCGNLREIGCRYNELYITTVSYEGLNVHTKLILLKTL